MSDGMTSGGVGSTFWDRTAAGTSTGSEAETSWAGEDACAVEGGRRLREIFGMEIGPVGPTAFLFSLIIKSLLGVAKVEVVSDEEEDTEDEGGSEGGSASECSDGPSAVLVAALPLLLSDARFNVTFTCFIVVGGRNHGGCQNWGVCRGFVGFMGFMGFMGFIEGVRTGKRDR